MATEDNTLNKMESSVDSMDSVKIPTSQYREVEDMSMVVYI